MEGLVAGSDSGSVHLWIPWLSDAVLTNVLTLRSSIAPRGEVSPYDIIPLVVASPQGRYHFVLALV